MTKIVIPFPIEHHNVDPREDYFELCRDICGGEFVSVMSSKTSDVIRSISGENVHAHGRGLPFPELSALFARKSVYTPHNNHLGSSGATRAFRKFVFNRYDWIAAQTEYGRRNYVSQGVNPKKIVVLPIPVNYGFFSRPGGGREFRKKFGLGDEPFVLCINARKSKKPEIIIDACEKVGVKLVLAGHKSRDEVRPGFEWLLPEPEVLEREGKDVVFTGNLDKYGVLAALDAANVYVNSSEDGGECFSLVVYEAACAGVPLCLPDFGLFEAFDGSALFHQNTNSDQLADNIKRYLEDERLAKKNAASAKKIAKKVDYLPVRKMYEKFYKRIGFVGDRK
jgi:glycosyltransferase involved in cell wall biosynthesis